MSPSLYVLPFHLSLWYWIALRFAIIKVRSWRTFAHKSSQWASRMWGNCGATGVGHHLLPKKGKKDLALKSRVNSLFQSCMISSTLNFHQMSRRKPEVNASWKHLKTGLDSSLAQVEHVLGQRELPRDVFFLWKIASQYNHAVFSMKFLEDGRLKTYNWSHFKVFLKLLAACECADIRTAFEWVIYKVVQMWDIFVAWRSFTHLRSKWSRFSQQSTGDSCVRSCM